MDYIATLSQMSKFACHKELPFQTDEEVDSYAFFNMDWSQFEAAQAAISGFQFAENIEASIERFLDRDTRLRLEAEENEEYGLPHGYCSYGYFQIENCIYLWYETTRGSVLCQVYDFVEKGYAFQICLPKSRLGGFHHKQIDYAVQGRTLAQQKKWYNAYLRDDLADYTEEAAWHNLHMTKLGYDAMLTGEQYALQRKIDNALGTVHGSWACEYGIGQTIVQKLLGYHFVSSPSPVDELPDPENGIKLVYKQLKDALENWETLAVELGVDLQTPDPLEDADYEYEYDEELTEKEREANQAMLDFAIESLGWA